LGLLEKVPAQRAFLLSVRAGDDRAVSRL
jgi:hypothetical protein